MLAANVKSAATRIVTTTVAVSISEQVNAYRGVVLQIILNYVGIAVFAASGATVGVRKGFDLFGIATLGVLTGVGGGVLRDLLLDTPAYSIQDWPAIAVDEGGIWFAAAISGMLTAIAGAMLRDVIAREVPYVMGPDGLYAIPALLGAVTYVAIDYFGPQWVGVAVGSALATLLRLAALVFHWRLPTGPRELIARDQ